MSVAILHRRGFEYVGDCFSQLLLTTCLTARSLGVGRRLTIYGGLRFMVYVWEFHLAPNALHLTVKKVRAARTMIHISRPLGY